MNPSLVARLNHPNSTVREQLLRLILKVAAASPTSIVYTAVVGATTQNQPHIKDALKIVVVSIKASSPNLVEQVREFICFMHMFN